jgi:hypothetical protein
VKRIQRAINRARNHKLDISGPTPGNIAGQPAYTIRVGPGRPGGLLGAVELAWDAAHGLPLRVAVYARGNNDPVLELDATEISYGPVDRANFEIKPPADAHVVDLSMRGERGHRRVPFEVSAPKTLAGRKRSGIRRHGGAAFIRYGKDLDGLLVIEKAARAHKDRLDLPTVDVNGSTAKVLETPLGTVVSFQRGGVQYIVLGSVHAADAEAAARGL